MFPARSVALRDISADVAVPRRVRRRHADCKRGQCYLNEASVKCMRVSVVVENPVSSNDAALCFKINKQSAILQN